MNQSQLKGKWNEMKGKVKERWGKLTDDDLTRAAGDRDQLIGLIQTRYGKAKEEANKDLEEWEETNGLR